MYDDTITGLSSRFSVHRDAILGFANDVVNGTGEAPDMAAALDMARRILNGQDTYHQIIQQGPVGFDRPSWDRGTDRMIAANLTVAWSSVPRQHRD